MAPAHTHTHTHTQVTHLLTPMEEPPGAVGLQYLAREHLTAGNRTTDEGRDNKRSDPGSG